ncbi:MAG: AMP-binding protein [Synergistaceae bacterium]|nr:AMP-binding protein [Synergistaceae bacterium]MBQ7570019.1 AMP-binding protein [Synergistaceae bacterium]MBQ9582576.1 AMP-binding protein [Synergistaceae bacterium]MBQ9896470.1 AMP-binding protein [Synergistaceae bacterium]MBR0095628.1 AMP-binding protein [Synergistaceae bacterium]
MNINFINSFEKTVELNFNKIAVTHNAENIAFNELKAKAQALGCLIINKAEGAFNKPVAVLLPKEINAVIADLGILYSANVFMNLDVKTPRERLINILDLIKPSLIITSNKYKNIIENIDIKIILIDEIDFNNININYKELKARLDKIIDTDPMCIINTSGSTGTPKGVVLNHRSFFDFMACSGEKFNFNGTEIIGSLSPIVFDIFDFELCMLMLYGSRLILLDAFLASFPVKLLEALNLNKVNFIFWVPSIMVNIANMKLLEQVKLEYLKLIWFAGEVFPTKQFLYWYDNLFNAKFANLYGPIEITLDCTLYEINSRPPENEPLPIGKPYKNTDVLILNENNKICGAGEEGELCVRGTSLAMGYYNNPEKTLAAFTQNPLNKSYPELIYRTGDIVYTREDGNIMFKGRKDSLIKHMGYRIELCEIEHVIENDLKLVKYCCAVYNYNKKEIVLYYENNNNIISDKDFRIALKSVFPNYMIPNLFIHMEKLPQNTNGKIDRLALKNLAGNI